MNSEMSVELSNSMLEYLAYVCFKGIPVLNMSRTELLVALYDALKMCENNVPLYPNEYKKDIIDELVR